MKKFILPKLMCLALIACSVPLSFAERYEKHEIYDYSDNTAREKPAKPVEVTRLEDIELPLRRYSGGEFYDDFDRLVAKNLLKDAKKLYEAQEEENKKKVTSLEELEFPLRRISYSEFRDDFDRVVADGIRKDAKKLYEAQEAEKEVSSAEEIELPIYKRYGISAYNDYRYDYADYYDCYSESEKVVFYDGLGRKISDSIAKDAKKLYDKQERANEWASWRDINFSYFWCGFWKLLRGVIYIVVLVFAVTFVWRKISDAKEKTKKS